ncbi:uncharacterized protein LOC123408259 [Hordeum vulgare subsp. vulgare]|uniref:uncharacterized protein LOC123408259 n=1 Tax=Hordeum vulgare subsp. vulgare TaxID=112509 RepID=UPI001D1A395D|nr:uncharacterized protein LOC123408259 [Hordeum vulgare subsp. vulgare]
MFPRRRRARRKGPGELSVQIGIEEALPDIGADVLSMSQHIPGLQIPILQLGDLVISVETARRQAEERGHALLDEIRILMDLISNYVWSVETQVLITPSQKIELFVTFPHVLLQIVALKQTISS